MSSPKSRDASVATAIPGRYWPERLRVLRILARWDSAADGDPLAQWRTGEFSPLRVAPGPGR